MSNLQHSDLLNMGTLEKPVYLAQTEARWLSNVASSVAWWGVFFSRIERMGVN